MYLNGILGLSSQIKFLSDVRGFSKRFFLTGSLPIGSPWHGYSIVSAYLFFYRLYSEVLRWIGHIVVSEYYYFILGSSPFQNGFGFRLHTSYSSSSVRPAEVASSSVAGQRVKYRFAPL